MCDATRVNDEMKCGTCGLSWDVSDPDRPACRKKTDRRAARTVFASGHKDSKSSPNDRRFAPASFDLSRVLPGVGYGCTIAPVTITTQVPVELSDPVALELAETYERLRGQGLGGIEAMRATYRLLLDRLP